MDDRGLLVFGCAVSFVFLAGVYVFLRERFDATAESHEEQRAGAEAQPQPLSRTG